MNCFSHSACLLLIAAATAFAGEHPFPFVQTELNNGLKVITLEDFSCPIVAVQVWYHVGSKNEQPHRQGFAHMFEHMMFRGTDRLNETAHFDNVRRVGGDCNAYTAFDNTTYIQVIPANQIEMVLWLESERMAFLKIDQKGFDTERRVVEEELRMGHNRPYGRVPENVLAEIYGSQCYGWTPGGQIADLRASSIDDLAEFWNAYYVPNNATLVIVGAVKSAQAAALAKKYFEWIPKCPLPKQPSIEPTKADKSKTIKLKENKGPLPVVGALYRAVPQGHPDALPLEMVMGVLGGGESSRLYVDIVKDKKIAQFAGAMAFGFELDGLAGAGGLLLPLGNKKELMSTMRSHIKRLRDEPVTPAELDKMKNQHRRREVDGALTAANKARLLGTYAVLFGDSERINRRLAEIDAVTVEDLQRVARKYLSNDNRVNVLIEPSAAGMLGVLMSKDDKEAQADQAAEKENRVAARTGPKAKAFRPKDFPASPPSGELLDEFTSEAHTDRTLASGLKVVVVENHEVPLFSMTLGVRSGSWSEQKPGVAGAAMNMLTQGTKTHSAKQLAEILESNAIHLNGSSSMDGASVDASALLPQLDLAAELLRDVIENPVFPKDEFDVMQQQTRAGLMLSARTPEYVAELEFRRRLYGEHPYARTETGELADRDHITIADLKAWWGEHLRPDNCVLYFAGDIKPDDAFKLAEKHLGSWKVDRPFKRGELAKLPKPEGTHIYLVDRPGSVQSQIRVGHLGVTRHSKDYPVVRVMANILGGGFNSRLNKAIRVEKGLTYGARGGFNPRRFAGDFLVSTFTKTPKTVDTLRTLLDELDKIRSEPPTKQELDDTKTYIAGSFPGARETPSAVVGDLWMIENEDLPTDYLRNYLAGVKKTTAQDVLDAAKRMIDPSKLTIIVVGEAKTIQADLEKIAPVTVVNQTAPPPEEKKQESEAVED